MFVSEILVHVATHNNIIITVTRKGLEHQIPIIIIRYNSSIVYFVLPKFVS